MTRRLPADPAPGPLEGYSARFDDLFDTLAGRQAFRRYLQGLLLPAERNKTLTALANTEPVVGAQRKEAQGLQWFLSESNWSPQEMNRRRVDIMLEEPSTAPQAGGALVVDETGDRKDGKATAHVGKQYLGGIGKRSTTGWSPFRAYGSTSGCTIRWRLSPTLRRTTSRAARTIRGFAPNPT